MQALFSYCRLQPVIICSYRLNTPNRLTILSYLQYLQHIVATLNDYQDVFKV
jgi:hypothetical protein